jgi:hypothetical protein
VEGGMLVKDLAYICSSYDYLLPEIRCFSDYHASGEKGQFEHVP